MVTARVQKDIAASGLASDRSDHFSVGAKMRVSQTRAKLKEHTAVLESLASSVPCDRRKADASIPLNIRSFFSRDNLSHQISVLEVGGDGGGGRVTVQYDLLTDDRERCVVIPDPARIFHMFLPKVARRLTTIICSYGNLRNDNLGRS